MGFGWIEGGKRISGSTFRVKRFVEKPGLGRAKKMLRSKQFSWNSGMFIWRADTILNSIKRFLPDIHRGLFRISPSLRTKKFWDYTEAEFPETTRVLGGLWSNEKDEGWCCHPSRYRFQRCRKLGHRFDFLAEGHVGKRRSRKIFCHRT